jgi:branched-chain amino acid aminotransferase
MSRIWINGKLFDKSDARISVYDHGFLYGDGVFEGIRVYSGKVFRLREHIERIYDSARAIWLEIPMPREKLAEAVVETVKANNKHDGYIRLVVSRGMGNLGLDPRKCKDPQVIIIVDDISLYPSSFYDEGLKVRPTRASSR